MPIILELWINQHSEWFHVKLGSAQSARLQLPEYHCRRCSTADRLQAPDNLQQLSLQTSYMQDLPPPRYR